MTLRGLPLGLLLSEPRYPIFPCTCGSRWSLRIPATAGSKGWNQPRGELWVCFLARVGFIGSNRHPMDNRVNCTGWLSSPCENSGAINGLLRWKWQPACPDSLNHPPGSFSFSTYLFSSESFGGGSQRCWEKQIPGVERGDMKELLGGHSQNTGRSVGL